MKRTYVNSSQSSKDIALLAGICFVNIPEPGKESVMDATKVKAMTGNDTLNALFLHENSIENDLVEDKTAHVLTSTIYAR